MGAALQNAARTEYWLRLLHESDYLTLTEFDSIFADADELVSLLTSIVKSSKRAP